jgi:DnaJ-domain-containing protein 1
MITTELKSHFLRLYQIAFSDDNFDVLELQMLYRFAEERGISKDQLNEILLNPSHNSAIPETLEKRIEYLYDLALMIWADKIVTEDEFITLKKYIKIFEFLDENIVDLANYLIDSAKKGVTKEEIIESINL